MQMAFDNTILRVVTGSELYGTKTGEGAGDRDEIGICIEDPPYVFGLTSFDDYVHRDAVDRATASQVKLTPHQRHSVRFVRSQPGDLDLTIYGLKRFLRMMIGGNPSLICVLYAPPDATSITSTLGEELKALAPALVSKVAAKKFLGYMKDQRERLMGLRGQKNVNRPELVDKYGYDTKFAGHWVRLGLQGLEFVENGRLTLPMRESERQTVVDVRTGKYTLTEVLELGTDIELRLSTLIAQSAMPSHPDGAAVDAFLVSAYPRFWAERSGQGETINPREHLNLYPDPHRQTAEAA